jgi:hypothetical protein
MRAAHKTSELSTIQARPSLCAALGSVLEPRLRRFCVSLDDMAARCRANARLAKRPDLRRKWQSNARIYELTGKRLNQMLPPNAKVSGGANDR